MIKLDRVSIETLKIHECPIKVQKAIKYYRLITIQDLVNAMETLKNVDFSSIRERLNIVLKEIDKSNEKGKVPNIYQVNKYIDSTLNYTDTLNSIDELLLSSPVNEDSIRYSYLSDMSISKMINYLMLTDTNGENYLLNKTRKIGKVSCEKMLEAINIYHDQVERQGKLTNVRDENVFMYQYIDKKMMVALMYSKLIAYLVKNASEFVWGEATESQKNALLSSVICYRKNDQLVHERMIQILAYYTTMEELDDIHDNNNFEPINRLIKR